MHDVTTEEIFYIDFKDRKYPCKKMAQKGGIAYFIKFDTRILCLTKFVSDEQMHWTAIPADIKLNHIVQQLGAQIDNHYKS